MSTSNGFSTLEGVLILIVLTVVSGVGFGMYNEHHSLTSSVSSSDNTASQLSNSSQQQPSQLSEVEVGDAPVATNGPQLVPPPVAENTPVTQTLATVGTTVGIENITAQDGNSETTIAASGDQPAAESVATPDSTTPSLDGAIDESDL